MREPEVYRYGVGNREMTLHPSGKYLSLNEVKEYLKWCLDDDAETMRRLKDFEERL